MRCKFLLLLLVSNYIMAAQELNATIKVNADQLTNNNISIFKTLEKTLVELVNKTRWTNLNFKNKEKIECSFFINITTSSNDQFSGSIQISSTRPVYNSTFSTPIFNHNDKDFGFRYIEFEPLIYNPNSYDNNLVSIIAFYANIIIGMDADSFAPLSGTDFYGNAKEIVAVAQQSSLAGWSQTSGNQNRFSLANDILQPIFLPFRETLYDYHYNGMDKMSDQLSKSKEMIKRAIINLNKIQETRPNSFLIRLFFNAKADEILTIFSGGPKTDINAMVENLNRFSPQNSSKWALIQF